jgi:hypothetical protein
LDQPASLPKAQSRNITGDGEWETVPCSCPPFMEGKDG